MSDTGAPRSAGVAWTFPAGRIFGISIRLHATFVLLLLWVGAVAANNGEGFLGGVAWLLLLIASVTLHELGHALVGRQLGVKTEEVVLLPIGGVARLSTVPTPRVDLAIAIAGPAANLLAIVVLTTVMVLRGEKPIPEAGPIAERLLGDLMLANVALFVFNVLPVMPLDGGRALRALLAMFLPVEVANRVCGRIGQAFAALLALVGLVVPGGNGFPLVLLALLLFVGASQQAASAGQSTAFAGRRAHDAMISRFERLAPQQSLEQAALLLLRTPQEDFPVIDAWGRPVGVLPRRTLIDGVARLGREAPVLEAMDRRVIVVAPDDPLDGIVRLLQAGAP